MRESNQRPCQIKHRSAAERRGAVPFPLPGERVRVRANVNPGSLLPRTSCNVHELFGPGGFPAQGAGSFNVGHGGNLKNGVQRSPSPQPSPPGEGETSSSTRHLADLKPNEAADGDFVAELFG